MVNETKRCSVKIQKDQFIDYLALDELLTKRKSVALFTTKKQIAGEYVAVFGGDNTVSNFGCNGAIFSRIGCLKNARIGKIIATSINVISNNG